MARKSPFQMLPRIDLTDDSGENENGRPELKPFPKAHPGTAHLHQTPTPSTFEEVQEQAKTVDNYSVPQLPSITPPVMTTAGRLLHYLGNWKKLTSDQQVLQIVSGYKIPLKCIPHQWRRRITKGSSKEQIKVLKTAIDELQLKGALKEVNKVEDQYISTLFVVKQGTKNRPVFNLKSLNHCVHLEKFKLEGLDMVRTLLAPGDYMMKLDLQDAYFMIPIHEEHKKYLRLEFQDKIYEFQCLPFGLSSAPRAFTRLLKPVIAVLRSSGIKIVIYLDDILIMHQRQQEIVNIFNMVLTLLKNLGFLIKREKCSPFPSQELVFLGALINSHQMSLAVPREKLQDLQHECARARTKKCCSMQELSAMIGRMNHMARIGIHSAPLHYRALQRAYINCLHRRGRHTRSSQVQIVLNSLALAELQWWTSPMIIQHNGTALHPPPVDLTITTDASTKGWGAVCRGTKTGGRWDISEAKNHINYLELKAVLLAIQAFVKEENQTPRHLKLLMDNTTAVAYINKKGGTRSALLAQLAMEVWIYCLSRNIWITAKHLPGLMNSEADYASRNFNNHTEWMLKPSIFRKITTRYYIPQVDLFASRLNNQVANYVARYPDPGALATDAFSLVWNNWTVFIHPPIVLIPRILLKMKCDKATGLLIAPNWQGQPWFPVLLEMLVDYPAQLPVLPSTISLPFAPEKLHPLWKTLQLAVWPISGLVSKQREFQKKCARFSWHPGEDLHKKGMKDHGNYGRVGVFNGRSVPFQRL